MPSSNVFFIKSYERFKVLFFLCVYFSNIMCLYVLVSSTESIKKIVDKSSIKYIHGIKLDAKNGKTEDRILVSCCFQPVHSGLG